MNVFEWKNERKMRDELKTNLDFELKALERVFNGDFKPRLSRILFVE